MHTQARAWLDRVGVDVDPRRPVGELGVVRRQLVEMAKALSLGDVAVVGFDGTPDGLEAVQQGTMHATIAQRPEELGKRSVELAVKAARGQQVPSEVKVPVEAVTQDNVAEFLGS